ncbi:thiol reductant ABC exporter subunit CydD, partial [Bacillus cereus]|nr:thiol reductant ABC exporter subunit CydD [Bacillus cereus]
AVTGLFNGKSIASLFPVIGFFLIAFVARHGVTVARQKIVYQYAARTGADVRKSFLDQLLRLGPRFAKYEGTGHMVTLAMEGIIQFRRYLELFLPKLVS